MADRRPAPALSGTAHAVLKQVTGWGWIKSQSGQIIWLKITGAHAVRLISWTDNTV